MKRRLVRTLVLLVAAASVRCGCRERPGVLTELVMRPGSSLVVKGKDGDSLRVVAGTNYRRRYEWSGCGLDAHPCPRGKRWFGSLGIYDSAPGFAYLFSSCQGISRPVVDEGQIHFAHQETAEAWLGQLPEKSPWQTTWRNDGLVVSWGVTPGRQQINVDVWQVCINGQKPSVMIGA